MNFTTLQTGGFADEDLVRDGWTDISQRIRDKVLSSAGEDVHARGHAAGLRRERRREDGRDPGPGRRHRRPTRPPPRRSSRGTASSASGRASTTSTSRPTTTRTCTSSTPTARAWSGSTRPASWDRRRRARYDLDCIIYASGFEVGTDYTRRSGLRRHRPRRPDAVGALGRRHAQPARHPRARLPQPVRRRSDPGRQPDLEHPAQPDRGRPDHRHRRPARPRRGRRRGGGHRGGRAGLDRPFARRRPRRSAATPTARPATTTTRARTPAARGMLNSAGFPEGPVAYFDYIDAWRSSGEFEGLDLPLTRSTGAGTGVTPPRLARGPYRR